MHHAASKFDIGIYYETNGHGTVLFSDRLGAMLGGSDWSESVMRCVVALSHSTVGDVIPTALLIPLILQYLSIAPNEWYNWWRDEPTLQSVVKVLDKSVIVTNANESKVTTPAAMQPEIDSVSSGCRVFVRPSGTEDVVRVYVEGSNAEDVIGKVEGVVRKFCGERSKL